MKQMFAIFIKIRIAQVRTSVQITAGHTDNQSNLTYGKVVTIAANATIYTVMGKMDAEKMGKSLVHEHIMVDWVGADQASSSRYDKDEVVTIMEPYLDDVLRKGYQTFFDCTPAYLARDVEVLRELSRRTGLNIVTNTGLYKEPYLPSFSFDLTAEQLAELWVREFEEGIDETGIRPGFIKIAVHGIPLEPIQNKIVTAAGLTSLATGLTIASHTGSAAAGLAQIRILRGLGLPLDRFIVVHLDSDEDWTAHERVYDAGAWLSYDSVGWKPIEYHVKLLEWAKGRGFLNRVLLSHDTGWYTVGKPGGGTIRPYTVIDNELIPKLLQKGVMSQKDFDLIFIRNPVRAFAP